MFVILISLRANSCKDNGGVTPDYVRVKGMLIGKEYCHSDTTKDYWLIALNPTENMIQYGDSLQLNDTIYAHVVKTLQLPEDVKVKGTKMIFDFKIISTDKIITPSCDIQTPVTYPLKEVTLLSVSHY